MRDCRLEQYHSHQINDFSLATRTDCLPISALRLESGQFVGKLFTMQIPHLINLLHSEMTAWRQDLHAHPELGFEEHRTSEFVASKLAEFGCDVHRNIGKTGVVGVLRTGDGPSIGVRADMDALPIHEANEVPYRSKHDGRMHACGHDGHTTMLLGAARYLAETRDFAGTVHFIFQPAEEGIGGAKAMLKDGLFERFPCDSVFEMHNRPDLPIGKFAIRPGPMMAGGAFFNITVTGKGSHAARPEEGIDPVLTACHVTTALQAIASRNIRPADTAVLSVTTIQAGDAYSVIPQTAVIRGTFRTFRNETMKQIEDCMRRTATGVAGAFGATPRLTFPTCSPRSSIILPRRRSLPTLQRTSSARHTSIGIEV